MAFKNMALLPKDEKSRKAYIMGLRIAGDFGAIIAIPVVLFVIIGQNFDQKYGTSPYLTILSFVISALISGFSIYKKAKEYGKKYKELAEDKKEK